MKPDLRKTSQALLPLLAGAAFLTTSASAQQIFWADDGGHGNPETGSIWTMTVGGSGPTELYSGLNRPLGVAIDAANGHLYWPEDGVNAGTSRIARANMDGSGGITNVFDEATHGFTNAQAVALRGSTLYWTDFFGGVKTGQTNGTGYTTYAAGAPNLTAIDIHDAGNHIFYGQPNGGTEGRGLYRMNLDGTGDQLVHAPMAEADWRFNTLAVDQATGQIYYGDTGENAIKRRDHDGSNVETITTDATAVFGITFFDDQIYWSGRGAGGGILGRVDTAPGSTSEILAADLPTTTNFGLAVIPEPGTYALLFGLGIGALVLVRRRFQS